MLVEIYFKMFTGMLEGKGAKEAKASKDTNSAVHSRILSAVLTGMFYTLLITVSRLVEPALALR